VPISLRNWSANPGNPMRSNNENETKPRRWKKILANELFEYFIFAFPGGSRDDLPKRLPS
jgi:hypothetical protein